MPALIFRGGVRGWGGGKSSTNPSSVLAGKDPRWPGNHVLFLMTLYYRRKIFNDIFFPFVLSSLTEGSCSLAGGLCEQDAAEQTSLILPTIEGALINPGNPRRAARVFLETRCSLPLGTAAEPASPATERSQAAQMRFPAGAVPCARAVPSQAARAASPASAVRAALQKSRWDLEELGQVRPGSRLHPLCSPRRAKCCGSRPWGAAQRVAFWMSSSAKNILAFFFFCFNFNTFGLRAVVRNLSRSWHPQLICHPP